MNDQSFASWLAGGAILAAYCMLSWFFSVIGGWRALSIRYATRLSPGGVKFHMQTGRMRSVVNYGGCLTLCVCEAGLRLAVWPPFRLAHPPLLIPWSDLRHVAHYRGLFTDRDEVAVGHPDVGRLLLSSRIFREAAARGYLPDDWAAKCRI